jgi:hypothetical protein
MEPEMFDKSEVYVPIPKIFHSVYEEGPFSRCIVCSRNLLDEPVDYMIEKAYRGTEVIVEYAICQACAERLGSELSAESTARIERYLAERVDWAGRLQRLAGLPADTLAGGDIEPWIDRCLINREPRTGLHSYQIYAKCRGSRLERTLLPFMVGGPVTHEMGKLLSKKTRDRLDDFVGDYLGMDPTLVDAPIDTPLLVL